MVEKGAKIWDFQCLVVQQCYVIIINHLLVYFTGISEEDKKLILDLHNQYRANEPAANMQKMVGI